MQFNDYLANLQSTTLRPISKMEFLNWDGTVAFAVSSFDYLVGGTVSVHYQDGCRRTASVTLDNWARLYESNINKIWYGQQIKISAGLLLEDGTPYYIPQGVFYITNPRVVFNPSERTTTLELSDKWCVLDGTIAGNLDGIYILPVNENIFEGISALLKLDRGDGHPFDNMEPLLDSYYMNTYSTLWDGRSVSNILVPYTSRINYTQTYADVLLEMNTMLVSTMGYDIAGRLVVQSAQADLLDSNKPVVYHLRADDGSLIEFDKSTSYETIYNEVVVIGANINGRIARGIAQNKNPFSPSAIGNSFTKRLTEEQPKYYADRDCQVLAEYRLKQYTAAQDAVSVTCMPLYHLRENQLVQITVGEVQPIPYLVNGFNLPLGNGAMTINCVSLNQL